MCKPPLAHGGALFGLTEPINTIFSVNALTESFWKVFGREAKQEQRARHDPPLSVCVSRFAFKSNAFLSMILDA
jgi:hypothetical protein